MGARKVVHSVLIIPAAMALAGCVGPRPTIVKRELVAPRSAEAPYLVLVTIKNDGSGEGQIEASARLRSKARGDTVAERSRHIDLSAFETVQVRFELKAPIGGDYELIVNTKYPP